jgi:hypothetical protein
LLGIGCGKLAWPEMWVYCLEWNAGFLPEMLCRIIARTGVWDYCLEWGFGLLLGRRRGIIAWTEALAYCLDVVWVIAWSGVWNFYVE